MKKSVKRNFLVFISSIILTLYFAVCASADLTVNLIAVNASETEIREVEIAQDLPVELEPEDIISTGELKIDYNVDKGVYTVNGKVKLKPKESKVFKVAVKDVWLIPPDEIQVLRDQLDSNLKDIEGSDNYDDAVRAKDRLAAQLNFIEAQQLNYSEDVNRRIEEYRANKVTLQKIRDNVYNIDFLKFHSVALNKLEDEKKTIKFVVQVKNPSNTETRTIKHKHFLPEEVRVEHVIDTKGFEIRFDEKKQRAFLTKEEEFGPAQVKKYEIIIKDIWRFPLMKVDDLHDRTLIAQGELGGTAFEESARYLVDRIVIKIDQIKASVETVDISSISKHIGLQRVNNKRFEEAWKDFQRIEEMISIVRAKKLQEYEDKKVKNVLQRLKSLRGVSALAEALFKKSLSITVTWRIIMGAIIFVALFTTIHFAIWAKRSKEMGEELAGDGIKIVPKPGEEEKEEDDEAIVT